MSDRKTDSKSNLNESTLPLLDDAEKEKIELKSSAEKTDAAEGGDAAAASTEAEKKAADDAVDAAKKKKEEEKERKRQLKLAEEEKKKALKAEKAKKKEEERELKKQKEAEKEAEKKAAKEAAKAANGAANGSSSVVAGGCSKAWSPVNQFTVGINLLDRDERSVNEHVNVNFEDIIGEPDAAQGFDGAYRLAFGLFSFVRFWVYRLLAVILAVPLALIWAVVFALLTLVSVWLLTPAFRVLDIAFYFVHRFWNATVRTLLDPLFTSISLVRSQGVKPLNQTPVASCSGKAVYRSGTGCGGAGYSALSTSETVASYTKTGEDGGDQVALNLDN